MIRHYVRWLVLHVFWAILAYSLACGFAGFWVGRATAQDHDMGHMLYHEQAYSRWVMPGTAGVSCCHAKVHGPNGITGDCRPTAAQLVNGHWRAELDPEEKPGPESDGWVTIPDQKILHEINPDPSGVSAHLCYNYGVVYCFVPPFGGG